MDIKIGAPIGAPILLARRTFYLTKVPCALYIFSPLMMRI